MRTALLVVLLATSLSAGDGKPDISLKVDPKIAFYGVGVHITTTIKPHPDNRAVRLEFEFGNSTWQLEGDKDDRIDRRSFVYKVHEPGEFEIRLLVFDSMGRVIASKVQTIKRMQPDQP